MTKRILSVLVALLMVVSLFPMSVFAAGETRAPADPSGFRKADKAAHDPGVIITKNEKDGPASGYARIVLAAEDIWGDGTGYQMLIDADATAYGNEISTTGAFYEGNAPASLYDVFEYKIPVDADGSLTTTHIVCGGSATIDIPAGIYDYCIVNPVPGDIIYIASNHGNASGRADDYSFADGCTYTFTATMGEDSYDRIDVVIDYPAGSDEAYPLPEGAVYGTSFENTEQLRGWQVYDLDGDGNNWMWAQEQPSNAYEGVSSMVGPSYYNGEALAPDDWLISPGAEVKATDPRATFYLRNGHGDYLDTVEVYVHVVGEDSSFDLLAGDVALEAFEPSTTYTQYTVDLSAYVGETVCLSFRHFNSVDLWKLYLDLFIVWGTDAEPEPEVIDTIEINGFTPPAIGEYPDYDMSVPANANYYISDVEWSGPDGYMPEDMLYYPSNWSYYCYIEITANDGCVIADNPTILINGSEEYVDYSYSGLWQDGVYGVYSIDFYLEDVEPTAAPPTLDEALNIEGGPLHFETSDNYPWEVFEDGDRIAAKSTNNGVASTTSSVWTTVNVTAGDSVSFDYKAWGEGSDGYDWDKCRFYVDDEMVMDYGAHDNDWETFTYTFTTGGEHTLTWTYKKDGSMNPTGDYFAVDEVGIYAALIPPITPPPVLTIDTIEIEGFTAPEWGANPDFDINVPDGANYSIDYSTWLCDGETMIRQDVFDSETSSYKMSIVVVPDEGYQFADDVAVTINGGTDYVGYANDTGEGTYHIFTTEFTVEEPVTPTEPPVEPTVIDTIEINDFVVPVWGEHPFFDVTVPEGAGYELTYSMWKYYISGVVSGEMTEEDVFDNSEYAYYQAFRVVPLEGYEFADEVTVLINGSTEYVFYDWTFPTSDYYRVETIDFTVEEPVELIAIHEVYVNGFVDPVPGMTAAEYMALFVDEDAPYTIDIIQAYDEGTRDELLGDEVLQEGHNYIVGARVFVDEGYYFTEDTTLLANGDAELPNPDFSGVADSETAWVVVGPTVCGLSDLDRALNIEGGTLHFETEEEGEYPWFTVTDEETGRFYAQSGNAGVHSSSSAIWTLFDSVEGDVLAFDFKAWGEGSGWDTCEFWLDEHRIFSYGARDNDWETYIISLEPGNHMAGWVYNKDSSVHPQGDYFAVDEVYVGAPVLPEEIEADDITVFVNHSGQIEWTVLPNDAMFKNVKFEVADESIASVDRNGRVRGLTVGDTEVTISIDYFPEDEPTDPYPYPTVSSTNDEDDPEYPEVSTTVTVHVLPVQDLVVGYYFETQPEEEGWQFIDADGDTYTWHWNWDDDYYDTEALAEAAYEGEGFIMSDSVLEPYTTESTYGYEKGVVEPEYIELEPDNWAVSPAVTLPNETAWMTFYASSFMYEGYDEHFELYIGLTDDIDEMEPLLEITPVNAVSYYDYYNDEMLFNYEDFYVDLTAYAGQTVYVAFRHLLGSENCNAFLALDAVEFFGTDAQLELIDTIEINDFVVPAWGEAPFYNVTVPEGAGYEVTYTDWNWYDLNFDNGEMADGDLFDNAEYFYWQYFEVTPLEGYAFAETVTVLINGEESLVDFAFPSDDGTYAVATIDFTVEEPVTPPPTEPPVEPSLIYAVDISELDIPVWGANPDFDVVLPADAQYLLAEFNWDYYNGDEDVLMAPTDVFDDADGEYYTIFVVDPEEGWEFAPDDEMTVTINGVEELVDFFFTWDGELYIVSIDFTVEEPPAELIPIHEVIVNGWGRPVPFVAGIDHVFLETPADAPYFIVYGGWRDETDQQQMWNEDHVFMPEHWYSEGCQIWADEGYYFAEDCVFRTEDDRVHLDYEYCYVDELDDWICYMNIEPILCILWGDAEHDNDVDSPDVLLLMRYCMDLVPAEDVYLDVCDVNADGDYTMADALLIMRKVLHLIDYFPVELIY